MSDVAVAEAPAAPAAAPSAPPAGPAEVVTDLKTAESAPASPEGETKPVPKTEEKSPESRDDKGRDRRKMSRLYREAAEWRAKAELFERQLSDGKPKAADPDAPKLENFNDIEAYAAAKAEHEKSKALKEHTAKQQSETQKQASARLVQGWEEKLDAGADKYDDFAEIVGELQPTSPWSMAIMEAENGPDIAYHLGKNLKEAQRIAALPPLSQAREIGKLEAKLLATPVPLKKPSAAPAPIAPLTGTSQVASNAPSEGDDDKTWFQKRLKAGARR